MNEQDLDRVIDTAAGEMIEREPSRGLRHSVMARVRESDPPAPRRFAWATAAAVTILCGVIAIAVMNRAATPSVDDREVRLEPNPTAGSVELKSDTRADGGVRLEPDIESTASRQPVALSVPRPTPPVTFTSNDLPSSIEPITAEPLVLSSIDLPLLENQAASVEQIEIDALTIEPLTASND